MPEFPSERSDRRDFHRKRLHGQNVRRGRADGIVPYQIGGSMIMSSQFLDYVVGYIAARSHVLNDDSVVDMRTRPPWL